MTNDTRVLLDDTRDVFVQYVWLPGQPAPYDTLALYVLHTHAFEAAHATPYLNLCSPEKQTGKTRALETLELLVRDPWRVSSSSPAAIYRKIAQQQPTLLLDEVDATFGSTSERSEALRAVLNAGNRPGSSVSVCIGKGSDQKVGEFPVFCAKVLAGIDSGSLPDTIRDRAIVIRMDRKTADEPVERFRYRKAYAATADLREAAHAWAQEHLDVLQEAEPDLPDELSDREQDAWEPLLAIADLAGPSWATRARNAAVRLSQKREEASPGVQLLAAIQTTLNGHRAIWTEELLAALNSNEELPFGDLTDRSLAQRLKRFHISPKPVRIGDHVQRGYRRDEFKEPFRRYLSETVTSVTPLQNDEPSACQILPGDLGAVRGNSS